jgi:hypothetical protein
MENQIRIDKESTRYAWPSIDRPQFFLHVSTRTNVSDKVLFMKLDLVLVWVPTKRKHNNYTRNISKRFPSLTTVVPQEIRVKDSLMHIEVSNARSVSSYLTYSKELYNVSTLNWVLRTKLMKIHIFPSASCGLAPIGLAEITKLIHLISTYQSTYSCIQLDYKPPTWAVL